MSARVCPLWRELRQRYPELVIAYSLPAWMSDDGLVKMRETPLWLDDEPPQRLLRALVADRNRD